MPVSGLVFADGNTAVVKASKASGNVMVGTYIALSVNEDGNDI